MSRRLTVLLAATAMVVAMLAVAGMAWAQTTQPTASGDEIVTAAADDPRIRPMSPNPGSETRDRTPTIKAKVTDNDHDLEKRDIRLFVDGDRVRNFDYSRSRDVLDYTPNNNLSLGRHTVKVVAVAAQGEKATERWSFRIVD
jgi:cytochrome c